MTNSIPSVALQLQSLIRNEGELVVSLAEVEVPSLRRMRCLFA